MDKTKRIFFKTEETVKTTKLGWMESEINFKDLYHNAWQWVSLLNGVCSRDFLLWVLSRIDENNTFIYSRSLYQDFVAEAKDAGTKEYEENTVHLALREFLEKGLATKLSRGVYQLKPAIFYPEKIQEDIKQARIVKQLNQYQGKEVMNVPFLPDAKKVMDRVESKEVDLDKSNFSGNLFSFDSFVD